MRMKYFMDTDTALLEFSTGLVDETREIAEHVQVDLDDRGNPVSRTSALAAGLAQLPQGMLEEVGGAAA